MLVLRLLSSFFKHLCCFCVHGRDVCPEERETLTGNQAGASTSSTEPRGLYQPCLYTKKDDKEDWLGEDDLVLFVKFCSIGKFCSTGGKFRVSSTFEDFILIPTGSKSFGQGTESHAGLSHEGLDCDSNNFVVAQPTTHFEDSYLLRGL